MTENVTLTDDELSLLLTSLTMTIASVESFVDVNGKDKLDYHTKKLYEEIKTLHDRLEKEYF